MIEQMQKLLDQCLVDTSTKRAKLYGLALLRTISKPRMVSQALGIGKDKRGYVQSFRAFYQDYAFIFTDETHQSMHEDVRDFLRQRLLAHRHEADVSELITRIYENQQRQLHNIEQSQTYPDLRTRLQDKDWVETFLNVLEAQFWADPSVGATYAISFILAASLYHPHLIDEVINMGAFFINEMESPQREWWSSICQSFSLLDSSLQPGERIKAVNDMKDRIARRKLLIPSPFTAYSQQLVAALWWQQGELYRSLDLLHEAFHYYVKALPSLFIEEQVAEATARLCWILAEKVSDSDHQSQIEFLTKAIKYCPSFQDAYFELGNRYLDWEEYQLARTYYQYVIELQPHDVEAWINLGVVHIRLEEYQRALDELNYAEYLDTTFAPLYFNRANVYRELKEYSKALKDFDQAIELDNTYVDAYTNRGNIYAILKQPERASQDYGQAIRLRPNDMQALWLQEWVHFGKQRVTKVVAQRLHEIATVDPNCYLAAVCVGVAKGLTQSDIKQALPELERGCRVAPNEWDPYFWLAMLNAYLNRFQQAAVALRKSVDLGLPAALLLPLYWLEKDRPTFFRQYALPLLQEHAL